MGMRQWVQCLAYRHRPASRPRHRNRSAREVGCSDVTSKGRAHALLLDLPEPCTDSPVPILRYCGRSELSKVRVRGAFSPASRPLTTCSYHTFFPTVLLFSI